MQVVEDDHQRSRRGRRSQEPGHRVEDGEAALVLLDGLGCRRSGNCSANYDLVHARALLMHLPARDAVLADLVAAVRPGGWLVIEEAEFFSTFLARSGVYHEIFALVARLFAAAGLATEWARHLPALFASAGLRDIVADADIPFFSGGGSAGAEFMTLTLMQLREAMLAGGCPEEDFDRCLAVLQDPTEWLPNFAIIGASGRRPS